MIIALSLIGWMFGRKAKQQATSTSFKLINDLGDGFYTWNGSIYKSDIVRACIRPKARAIGKLVAKHVRSNQRTKPFDERTNASRKNGYSIGVK